MTLVPARCQRGDRGGDRGRDRLRDGRRRQRIEARRSARAGCTSAPWGVDTRSRGIRTANHGEGRSRVTIYLAALAEAGIAADESLVMQSDFSEQGGSRALDELDRRRVDYTAVFAADDLIAIGILSAAQAGGRRVPKDLSVVGFDDVLPAGFIVPALTTVRQDATGLSERAVQAFVSPEGRGPRHTFVLPVSLVIRGSTGLPPKSSAASRRRNRGATDRRH